MAEFPPPFYLLLAHSPLSNLPTGALSNTLAHPVIQYHYADDSPLSIMPTQSDEHVLVFDYNPRSKMANIQSISDTLAVTGFRVEEAPGAVADEAGVNRNTSMFIVETTTNDQYVCHQFRRPGYTLLFSHMTATHMDRKAAQATLAQFKHRWFCLFAIRTFNAK